MPTLLILQDFEQLHTDQVEEIRKLMPDYDLWLCSHPVEEDPDRLPEVEISAGFKPPEELMLNPGLKWYHAFSAGVDWLFSIKEHQDLALTLTNSSGIHGHCMSEHLFAMILTFERSFVTFIHNQKAHYWEPLPRGGELNTIAGKTMLILGFGAIGEHIAKVARAFDMKVIGVRRQPERLSPLVDAMYSRDQLDEALSQADYIVSILPNTPDTLHILGKPQFAQMKASAFVVNLGRGVHIDEAALVEALQTNTIRGAALDTFEKEPLPETSPLWSMDNVIISPHCGGFQPGYKIEAMKLFMENLKRYRAGKPLINVVDKRFGYSLSH